MVLERALLLHQPEKGGGGEGSLIISYDISRLLEAYLDRFTATFNHRQKRDIGALKSEHKNQIERIINDLDKASVMQLRNLETYVNTYMTYQQVKYFVDKFNAKFGKTLSTAGSVNDLIHLIRRMQK